MGRCVPHKGWSLWQAGRRVPHREVEPLVGRCVPHREVESLAGRQAYPTQGGGVAKVVDFRTERLHV